MAEGKRSALGSIWTCSGDRKAKVSSHALSLGLLLKGRTRSLASNPLGHHREVNWFHVWSSGSLWSSICCHCHSFVVFCECHVFLAGFIATSCHILYAAASPSLSVVVATVSARNQSLVLGRTRRYRSPFFGYIVVVTIDSHLFES